MSLLSRGSKRALPILIVLAIITLLAIPVTWTVRAPWTAIGPSLAWAGSPDETLNPPPVPPKSGKRVAIAVVRPENVPLSRQIFSNMDAKRDALSDRKSVV